MSESHQNTILVVDNTPANADLFLKLLKSRYQVLVASTGERALELAHGIPRPDLILLDIMMPGMDGYEVCRRLKADETTAGIPIIFVTAKSEVEDDSEGFGIGAVDYITKPVSLPHVLARVNTHLALSQAHHKLEQKNIELQRIATELARSNKELEQFASVASHDLQEPLRAVSGYVTLIDERMRDQMDAKSQHYIEGAIQGVERMQRLITDLLALSRVGTQGKNFELVDLNAMLEIALQCADAKILETDAQITHDPLPTIDADDGQMAQLFQNLIGNAIKFRGDRPPRIHIGVERRDDCLQFFVRDNGIGIEPQYYERIFLIFQRLHTRMQYSGTGIGLAICRKIIELHGGRIWVESEPGHGSTFYFTIPNKGV